MDEEALHHGRPCGEREVLPTVECHGSGARARHDIFREETRANALQLDGPNKTWVRPSTMIPPRNLIGFVLAALALPFVAHAQKVVLTAEITAAQEAVPTASAAVGEAVMKYDLETNTFDLEVRLKDFTETLNASHIHRALPGVSGPVVQGLGGESEYKRSGDRLRLKLKGQAYVGDPAELLTGGTYLNFHTPLFPAGAIRGQLLPHTADFIAVLAGDKEVPANDSKARGVARVRYNFLDDTVDVKVTIANFTNTITGSHIHQAPAGSNGPVVVGLGAAAAYRQRGKSYHGEFEDLPYNGDLLRLLNGDAYINVHSNVFPGGEIRGQLRFLISHRGRD
jgi:Cu/Zn superoxide dismutase